MAQQRKAPALKLDDLSSIPGPPIKQEERTNFYQLSSDLHVMP